VPGRRAKFPQLQFVSEGARTTVKPRITRSHVSKNVQSSDDAYQTSVTCLQSNCDDEVTGSDLRFEHTEQQAQTGTAEDVQLTKRHRITDSIDVAHSECVAATDCSDDLTSCNPAGMRPSCCPVVDDAAGCNHATDGRISCVTDKDATVTETSPSSAITQKQDLTVCAENISGVQFDINTPTCEVEPSVCSDDRQKVVNDVEAETETCENVSGLADDNSIEPVRVLCFSHIDRSLDETEDPLEHVICAAELHEHMSELLERNEDTSVSAHVSASQSLLRDRRGLFSTLNSLTPFEHHCKNTVLVSDTPVSDYGLSYRQRLLKAANIRLRHRTHQS